MFFMCFHFLLTLRLPTGMKLFSSGEVFKIDFTVFQYIAVEGLVLGMTVQFYNLLKNGC